MKKALALVAFNNFVCGPIFSYVGYLTRLLDAKSTQEEIPSFSVYLAQIGFMVICEDLGFYWMHRLLHHPSLYPHIHKIHHEWYDVIVINSEYAHPVEFFISNLFPAGLGLVLLWGRAHWLSYQMFIILRLAESAESHGGYDFPWAISRPLPFCISSSYHNYHHLKNTGNYASWFILWDSICGTDSYYYNDMLKYGKEFEDYQTADRKEK